MNREQYETPVLEIVNLTETDIICTSIGDGDNDVKFPDEE